MAYGPPTTLDPTNVMGRRIGAWFIDAIPAVILGFFIVGSALTTVDNVSGDFCDAYRATHSSSICFQSGTSATYGSTFAGASVVVSLIYWFLNAGLLQGVTGATVGKHIVGLRVVDQNGNPCGTGKALLRTLIGVFELGFCFLVGLITALATHPHRRIGDMAAGTFVVAKQSLGTPIATQMGMAPYPQAWTPPGQTTWGQPSAGEQPWGAPAPGWGTPPSAGPPPAAAPPAWGTPAASPPVASPSPATGVTSEPTPEDAPGWGAPTSSTQPAPAPTSEPAPAATPQASAPGSSREPQWDAQRNAWVYWEAETSRWLQFDAGSGQWGPLR